MEIAFNITGSRRKQLIEAVGNISGNRPVYQGLPSYAFKIGDLIISKTGTLIIPGDTDHDLVDHLMTRLLAEGFTVDQPDMLAIELPQDGFTDEAVTLLRQLLKSKESLIKKALGVESLTVEQVDGKLRFPWFTRELTVEEIKAYTHFICALADLAKKQKRVLIREAPVINYKYAFRCYLIRLGFIGDDSKAERRTLLSRLSGNSAYSGR
jgi:hypothetical protein